MRVKAKAKYIRMSPRKVRLVVDLIRGLDVEKAYTQLEFINKLAAQPVKKLIDSAVANAYHNFEIEKDNLFIKEIRVDEGPTLYRWTPKAYGRATPIRKRSSHIWLILDEKVPGKSKVKSKKKDEKKQDLSKKPEKTDSKIKEKEQEKESVKEIFEEGRKAKTDDKKNLEKAGKQKGFMKKVFKRKSNT